MYRERKFGNGVIIQLIGLVIFFFNPVSSLYAQLDSLRVADTKHANTHFVVGLDCRSTIIEGQHININGVLTGVSFGKKSRMLNTNLHPG